MEAGLLRRQNSNILWPMLVRAFHHQPPLNWTVWHMFISVIVVIFVITDHFWYLSAEHTWQSLCRRRLDRGGGDDVDQRRRQRRRRKSRLPRICQNHDVNFLKSDLFFKVDFLKVANKLPKGNRLIETAAEKNCQNNVRFCGNLPKTKIEVMASKNSTKKYEF